MDLMKHQPVAREATRAQTNRDELIERIARVVREDGGREPLKGLHLYRVSSQTELHSVSSPAFCAIAQGCKEVLLANERYRYDPAHYLLYTAELPIVSHVIEASSARPYLSLRVDLDPTLVGSVLIEAGQPSRHNHADVRAIGVNSLDAGLLDAVVRLVRLLDSPADMRFLAPMYLREIVYRLFMGEQSGRLRQIAAVGGNTHRIVRAIERLRKEFDQPLRIDEMAQDLGMSVSGFHHQFKTVTGMSPLQFQKRLRLQEARRLMMGEHLDAASTAYRVGYDDASHFNREYKRLFGLPPMRDVDGLREAARHSGGLGMR
jgi:AraC-like DNA-binding protein